MSDTKATLPEFDRPPVIETAMGVEFAPLAGFQIPHFGSYWEMIRGEYPTTQTVPAINSKPELFGKANFIVPQAQLEIVEAPDIRCWFVHKSGERLIQVQRDRFIHNWRKQTAATAYPRYQSLKPRFEAEWGRFVEFARTKDLPVPTVTQCEVTYINHLERGKGWESISDVAKVFSFADNAATGWFVGRPDTIGLNLNFVIGDQQGRLRTSIQHALRTSDGVEVLQFTLTARGAPRSSAWDDLSTWFDLGREWVVRGFADLTRPEMHQIWGRRERS